jgi:hypothetical protein
MKDIVMHLKFIALPTIDVRALQAGGLDAYGLPPEQDISDGIGNPCRHCLKEIDQGQTMLILSYRPFPTPQPYAETGPIFLCADQCPRHRDSEELPEMFQHWDQSLIRGYSNDHRIIYNTGKTILMDQLEVTANDIFEDKQVAYIHMRSSSYNCYQCRIERG